MKKQFFYLAVSALAFTACTSEDLVEDATVNQNAISFENVVNKLSRADEITSGNLSQFNVFGFYTVPGDDYSAYEIFDDVLVKRNGVDWEYKSDDQELRYWLKGNRYYFYAYNCGNAAKLSTQYGTFSLNMNNKDNLTAAERVLIINNYVCDNTHQHDLIYASNVGGEKYDGILAQETANAAVALQFKHILSKVNARFISKFPSEYTAVIKNVAIQNIRNIGNYHPVSGWQNVHRSESDGVVDVPLISLSTTIKDVDGKDTNISVTNGVDNKGQQLAVYTDTGFVLPFGYSGNEEEGQPSTQVYLTFDIEVLNQGNIVYTKSLKAKLNPTWQPGYFYTYNVELSGSSAGMQAIVFTTSTDEGGRVIDWTKEDVAVGLD